jgi:hypothetical protein
MRKTLYASIGALLFLSTSLFAQQSKRYEAVKRAIDTSAPAVKAKPRATAKDFGDPIWTEDFATFDNWTVSNQSTPAVDWIRTTDASIIPVGALSPFASTTVANGFAFVDGDGQGEGSVQDCNLTLTTPIDLSASPNVSLIFEQNTRNFASSYFVRVSPDNGATWTEIQVNPNLATNTNTANPETTVLNISAIAGGQSQVLIEFNFTADWGWHWAIDDIAIVETPADDLSLNDVWYDSYIEFLQLEEFLDVDYVQEFEYSQYKTGQVRPLTFVARVENLGQNTQTGVVLTVEVNTPAGTETFSSSAVEVESGTSVLISIPDVNLAAFASGGEVGDYTVTFSITQDQEDQVPDNNAPLSKSFSVNTDLMANDLGDDWTTFYPTLGDDVIWGSRYMFEEETPINFIQFGILSTAAAPSQPGDVVYLNISSGSVLEAAGGDNVMTRYFEDEEIEYVLVEEDFTTSTDVVWITMPLPADAGFTVEPGVVYQAEVQIPPVGEPYLWVPFSNQQEDLAGVLFEFADLSGGPQGWWTLGGNNPHLRLGYNSAVGVDGPNDLTFKLGQNYPNPTTGSTRIDWELLEPADNVQFRITDINGRTVYQKDLGSRPAGVQESMELSLNLASGTYQYALRIDNHVIVRKLVIAK